jgi:hypothetical protein
MERLRQLASEADATVSSLSPAPARGASLATRAAAMVGRVWQDPDRRNAVLALILAAVVALIIALL